MSFSIRILSGEERVPIHEFNFGGPFSPTSKVTTVEYDLKAQKLSLPSQWVHTLTDAWEDFRYDHEYFKTVDLKAPTGSRRNFGSISQLEALLNVDLVSSSELEAVTGASFVTLVITDPQRAKEEYEREGEVTPDGLVIYLPFQTGRVQGISSEIVDYCGIHIYIPLTDSFTDHYRSHVVLSGVGDQDLQKQEYRSRGGIDTIFLTNTPGTADEPLKAFAAWEHSGVGYLLELKTHQDTHTDPTQLILPYLTDLE